MNAARSPEETRRIGDVLVSINRQVVTAVIDRPEKRNAISYGVIEGIQAAIDTVTERDANVLVLRGAGGNFCAGADLSLVKSMLDDADGLDVYLVRLGEICDRLADGPFVSIAVVTGYALAGGCELMLACDLAVVSEDAQIGDRHLRNSLLPGAGNSVRLMRGVTPARARRLVYTAEMINGRTAEEWGLVSAVYPPDELEAGVRQLVDSVATKSAGALRAAKEMLTAAEQMPFRDALTTERRIFVDYGTGNETVRSALVAFLGGGRRDS